MHGSGRSLVKEIYEASVIPDRWPRILDRISEYAGAAGGCILTERNGARLWTSSESLRPGLAAFYAQGWHERSAWTERSCSKRRLHFYDETDLFAPGEVDSIPLYRDFIHRYGYGWSAGTYMQIPTGGRIFMRFERRFESGPLRTSQRNQLNLLRPHLARASLLFLRLGLQQARSAVSVLQTMDVPAAVLTHSGRLLACNAAMEDRLSQVSVGSGDRIALTDTRAHKALSESLTQITAGLFDRIQGPIAIPATEEHEAAVAYLIPMQGAAQDIVGHGTAILMIRPAQPENRPLDLVRAQAAADPSEAQGLSRAIAPAYPRLAAALLASTENVQVVLDRFLGQSRTGLEARLARFLRTAGDNPTLGSATGQAASFS
jgi:hypothetical protein